MFEVCLQMRISDLLEFCTFPVSSHVVEVRVPTTTGEPLGIILADRPRTFCPMANTLKEHNTILWFSNFQYVDHR